MKKCVGGQGKKYASLNRVKQLVSAQYDIQVESYDGFEKKLHRNNGTFSQQLFHIISS